MTTMTLAKALNAGMRTALAADPKVLLAGEDIGKLGGVFRITEGLQAEFGENRVVDSPLAESGIIGTAVGLCMRGYRPVVEIQFDGFVYPAFDQITSQLSRLTSRHEGRQPMPVINAFIERELARLEQAAPPVSTLVDFAVLDRLLLTTVTGSD